MGRRVSDADSETEGPPERRAVEENGRKRGREGEEAVAADRIPLGVGLEEGFYLHDKGRTKRNI